MKHGDDQSKRANRRRKVVLVILALLLLTVLLIDLFQPDSAAQPADATLETLVEEGAGEAPDDGRCLYADYCVDYVAGRDTDAASTNGRVTSVRAGGGSDAGQLFDRLSPRAARFEYDANFGVACSSPELCLGGLGAGAPIATLALSVGNKPLPEETGERLVLQGYLPREAWGRAGGWSAASGGAREDDASDGDLALVPGGGIGSFNGGLTAGGGFGGGGFVGGPSGGRSGSPGTPVGNGPEQQPPARNQGVGDSGSNGGAGGGGANSGGANNAGGGGNSGGGSPGGGNAGGGDTPGDGNNPGGGGNPRGSGNPGGGSNGPSVPLDQYLDDEIGGGSGGGGGNLFTPPGDPDDSVGGSGSSGDGGGDHGSNGDGGGQVVIEDLPEVGDDDEEDLHPSEVPEPANLVLVGTGLAYGLLQWRKRRNRT